MPGASRQNLIQSPPQPYEEGTVLIPVLHRKKLKLNEIK